MRGPWAVWFVAAALAAVCGCRNSHLVESELRARETQVRGLRDELDGCRAHNQALEIELRTLRGDGCVVVPGPGGAPGVVVPPAYPIRSLALGRQTGGHPSDHGPGDDALVVHAEPRDAEGHAVKVPGSGLLVQAVEISSEGLKRPLSTWEVPPDELRNTWRGGLLSSGYSLTLPWKAWPTSEKLRVVAQLRLPDGRIYEADKDVSVRVCPAAQRPSPAPVAPLVPTLPVPTPPAGSLPQQEGPMLPQIPPATEAKSSKAIWHTAAQEPAVEVLRPIPLDQNR
jgi:hypothetical protein